MRSVKLRREIPKAAAAWSIVRGAGAQAGRGVVIAPLPGWRHIGGR